MRLAAQPVEQAKDAGLNRHIEGGGRLVGDKCAWSAGERDRDRYPLPHSSAELMRIGAERAQRVGDAHLLEQSGGAGIRGSSAESQVEAQVLRELPAGRHHRVNRRYGSLAYHNGLLI